MYNTLVYNKSQAIYVLYEHGALCVKVKFTRFPTLLAFRAPMCYNCAMKKTMLYLTEEEARQLKEASEESGLSMSEIIRRMLDSYFLEEDRVEKRTN